jgi:hypothetical protein
MELAAIKMRERVDALGRRELTEVGHGLDAFGRRLFHERSA